MFEKTKAHVKRHREAYIVGGVCLAGIIVVKMAPTRARLRAQARKSSTESTLEIIGASISAGKDLTMINSGNVLVNMGGYTKKLVQNTANGELFGSVTEAAEKAGVTIHDMSRHLNGHKDHINGDLYKIVGLGTTS